MISAAELKAERRLLEGRPLYSAEMVAARPSPIPQLAGVYAWYFTSAPSGVPVDGCHVVDGLPMLYVGISPKVPPASGSRISRQTIRSRIRYHYRGNAYGSTLRLTLGSLLAEQLGLALRRVGSGTRMTFGHEGEQTLSAWMAENARVVWADVAAPWRVDPLCQGRVGHAVVREV